LEPRRLRLPLALRPLQRRPPTPSPRLQLPTPSAVLLLDYSARPQPQRAACLAPRPLHPPPPVSPPHQPQTPSPSCRRLLRLLLAAESSVLLLLQLAAASSVLRLLQLELLQLLEASSEACRSRPK